MSDAMTADAFRMERPRGYLRLAVHRDGAIVARRQGSNLVLRAGALLIAQLFSGAAGAKPIDTVGVGFATDPGGAELTALTPPPGTSNIPATALRTALAPTSVTLVTDQADVIQVKIAAVFKPTQDLAGVTEAGLLSGTVLYNQVIFEPVTLHGGQDVTFFWQIDFPFGH
jgi:hypothetical protein